MDSQPEEFTASDEPTIPSRNFNLGRFMRQRSIQIGVLGVFILVWAFFIVAAPETFLSRQIYLAFMSTVPFFGIPALTLTILVIAREIDLSFSSIMAMGMVGYVVIFNATESVPLGVLAGLLVGFGAGLLNGVLVVWVGIPSLIATLGTLFMWRGAALVILEGKGASLGAAKGTFVYNLMVGETLDYIPNQFIWMVLIAVACWILLNRTRLGAHAYLVGDNENSARLMGVNVGRTKALLFAILGLSAAFAGMLSSMHTAFYWPSLGEGFLLLTIASVFLGGTSAFGGVGTIMGTFLGAFIIGAIGAAIVAIGLTGFYTELIYGLILIVSVALIINVSKRVQV